MGVGNNLNFIFLGCKKQNFCCIWQDILKYSGPSLKGHSRKDTPLERTQIFGGKYCERMWCSLSPKDTSLIRTEFFGRSGVLIRELYWGFYFILFSLHYKWCQNIFLICQLYFIEKKICLKLACVADFLGQPMKNQKQ